VSIVSTSGLAFYPVTPCRVADTRNPTGPFGGPIMAAGSTRSFTIPASNCGIPSTAQAYSLNVTVVPQLANAAIVPAGSGGSLSVYVSDTSNVILDIDGYFAPPGS